MTIRRIHVRFSLILVNHPNAGGVLVLGLGCENSNIDELKKHIGDYDAQSVSVFLLRRNAKMRLRDALKIVKELIA
ncbi:MAG: UxaA family hydrolase [Ruminococcus sp.]